MLEASLGASAPLVLGAFADKHGPNHGAMWEMVLTYCRRFPGAWDAVDTQKMVVPRLTSFLRCPPHSSLIMYPLRSHLCSWFCTLLTALARQQVPCLLADVLPCTLPLQPCVLRLV